MQNLYLLWKKNPNITLTSFFIYIQHEKINFNNISFRGLIDIDSQIPIIANIKYQKKLLIDINIYQIKSFLPLFKWIEDNQQLENINRYLVLANNYLKQYLVTKYIWLNNQIMTLKSSMPKIYSLSQLQSTIYKNVDFDNLIGIAIENFISKINLPNLQIDQNLSLKDDLYLGGQTTIQKHKLSVKVNSSQNLEESNNIKYHKYSKTYTTNQNIGQRI